MRIESIYIEEDNGSNPIRTEFVSNQDPIHRFPLITWDTASKARNASHDPEILFRESVLDKKCDPHSNLFQVVKKSLSSLITRFESGNLRVMN